MYTKNVSQKKNAIAKVHQKLMFSELKNYNMIVLWIIHYCSFFLHENAFVHLMFYYIFVLSAAS